jgi:hypothetical protein
MSARRARAAAVLVFLVLLARVQSAAATAPAAMDVGNHHLTLQGQGIRSKFFVIDLYSVALYLPRRIPDVRHIWDADVPKALRVEILYGGSLPDKIPTSWSRELLPSLTFEQKDAVAEAWATLSAGDTIRLTYTPESGTSLVVGNRLVLSDPDDALMRAFLDLWVGKSPVSKELRGSLLGD